MYMANKGKKYVLIAVIISLLSLFTLLMPAGKIVKHDLYFEPTIGTLLMNHRSEMIYHYKDNMALENMNFGGGMSYFAVASITLFSIGLFLIILSIFLHYKAIRIAGSSLLALSSVLIFFIFFRGNDITGSGDTRVLYEFHEFYHYEVNFMHVGTYLFFAMNMFSAIFSFVSLSHDSDIKALAESKKVKIEKDDFTIC